MTTNKYGYKEVRKIHPNSLRKLCIENGWYTCGTCEEYESMLDQCSKDNLTTDDIVEIATDIMSHSDDNDRDLVSYCFEIARIAYTFFEEV